MNNFMSLIDRLIDNRDAGPAGSVNFVTPLPYVANGRVVAMRAMVGLTMIAAGAFFAFKSDQPVLALAALVAYLAISFAVVPQADTANLGYLGYADRPLRWSDWGNRYLLIFRFILWPGRFALSTLRDAYWHARGRKSIVLYRTVDDSSRDDT